MDIAKSPPRSFWRHQRGWLALAIGVTVLAAVAVTVLGAGRAASCGSMPPRAVQAKR
ncbi:hypothetical protein [Xanthomonas phaseoli]|uniref:Uncharacterized protein n=1 Tax=Xanthomonas manihotis TaxID=43353 RepID=A0A8I1XG79_XANMN|nr:hypothetical protein [Xanthomonas phaseoli]KUF26978.1 hypothetical protein AO826_08580 [Xanthomonas phaseoli pv. manihotis]MBO9721766.1 hypothetical protein [Xanthomonas phaseoli pv. manihotis]MBO9757320.1 hypothetical protein [Xanthomonas phaseoli pv. manihotis]MBO9758764.1 hypothetical protein [Xanthomonas phaseoli pv. manihotis]MBO9763379.1 hypothetical protein [Xanthomonas phaseoli pv. manihotis]